MLAPEANLSDRSEPHDGNSEAPACHEEDLMPLGDPGDRSDLFLVDESMEVDDFEGDCPSDAEEAPRGCCGPRLAAPWQLGGHGACMGQKNVHQARAERIAQPQACTLRAARWRSRPSSFRLPCRSQLYPIYMDRA